MNTKSKKIEITFISPNYPNWANISSISKEFLNDFIKYLYSLNRDIEVYPYIPGGGVPLGINPNTDKTYIVKDLVKSIKNKESIYKVLDKYFFHVEDNSNEFGIYFIEDLYEFYLSLGIDKSNSIKASLSHYNKNQILEEFKNIKDDRLFRYATWRGNGYLHIPNLSRWVFIYMFRNEFENYMIDKHLDVSIKGGYILNNKRREIKLGLINEDGSFIRY